MGRFKRMLLLASMAVMGVVSMALPALATTPLDDVNSGVSDIVDDLTSIVTTNIPVIFALVALTIAVPFAIRLVKRLAK